VGNCIATSKQEQEEIERIFQGFSAQIEKEMIGDFHKQKKRVIVIAGPTACGKSAFGMALADLCYGEIISADSMQVYREMDIGTAKPSESDMKRVTHHLINTRNLYESYNVVDFYFEARQACQTILKRDNTPIVVGGSGFYLHSLIYGPPSGPPSLPELRQSLEEESERLGLDALFLKLEAIDPEYAMTITRQDKQKIIRGLEICTLTGKPVSKLSWKNRNRPQTYDFRCWFLHRSRDNLYKRIDDRCDEMLRQGFLEEVVKLDQLGLRENLSASQSIGYRQALEYLDSGQNKSDYDLFVNNFKQASRRFAKRQYTWFRKEPLFRWLNLEHDQEIALDIVRQDYESLS